MRLIDYFDRGADRYPERDCLHDGTRGWIYAEVRDLSHRIATGLIASPLGYWRPGSARATRLLSTVPTMRWPMPVCSASCGRV